MTELEKDDTTMSVSVYDYIILVNNTTVQEANIVLGL